MQAAAGRLVREGFALEPLASLGCVSLAKAVQDLTRFSQWKALTRRAEESEPSCRMDDPTSLGLQIVSRGKGEYTRLAAFGSDEMMRSLKGSAALESFGLSITKDREGSENAYVVASDAMASRFRHLSLECYAAANEIMSVISGELGLEWEREKEMEWEHEALANFYTRERTGMYAHTDKSFISMVMVPRLWLNGREEENSCKSSPDSMMDHKGLQVQTRDNVWLDIDSSMARMAEPSVLLLTGEFLGKHSEEGRLRAPAVHRVVANGRCQQRVSLAYFLCSRSLARKIR